MIIIFGHEHAQDKIILVKDDVADDAKPFLFVEVGNPANAREVISLEREDVQRLIRSLTLWDTGHDAVLEERRG